MGKGRKFRKKDRSFAQKRRAKEVRYYELNVQKRYINEMEVRAIIDVEYWAQQAQILIMYYSYLYSFKRHLAVIVLVF
jgi:hypothetical protein